ncbi:TetR family transcriptional regulator [Heliobacterium undosum]|uniref:TetR family transcriptional regulator n=1 Tax=Heliomicrobium undosum TaxID=121734 RepID=A0A845L0M9_9FIRM|nr:TetR/AcrR family transcriptional regulator [Heliomicrobium undosum]MZP29733.1 TetR family transcriptional regulator [Heliomicrobium undosum]
MDDRKPTGGGPDDYQLPLRLTDKQWNIAEAALRVFTEKGFSAATTSEIAREAGISEGTIFRHFKTKKEILLALLVPLIRNTIAPNSVNSIRQLLLTNENLPLREVLVLISEERQQFILGNEKLIRLILTESQYHPELREIFFREVGYKTQDVLLRFIEQRQQKGELRQDLRPWALARSWFGMLVTFTLSPFLMPERSVGEDKRKEIEDIIDLFLRGALPPIGGGAEASE